MLKSYYTIANNGEHELTIRNSRFICSLARAYTEEEAKAFIQAIKKEHWKATHNCSAYLIGDQDEIQRAHDDGEPSGTAGVPMLEVLKKNDLHYVVAVVTRYFGGTKLGAGGLIRAYGKAVSSTLKEISLVERALQVPVAATVSYSGSGKLENKLLQSSSVVLNTAYTDQVTFTVGVPSDAVDAFQSEILDFMNGNVEFETGKPTYVDRPLTDSISETEWDLDEAP